MTQMMSEQVSTLSQLPVLLTADALTQLPAGYALAITNQGLWIPMKSRVDQYHQTHMYPLVGAQAASAEEAIRFCQEDAVCCQAARVYQTTPAFSERHGWYRDLFQAAMGKAWPQLTEKYGRVNVSFRAYTSPLDMQKYGQLTASAYEVDSSLALLADLLVGRHPALLLIHNDEH